MGFLSNLFGKKNPDAINGSLTGPDKLLTAAPQPYPRVRSPQSLPGVGYTTALMQFQEYPENLVQGHGGVMVARFFKSFEPQFSNAVNTPVNAGTSGTIAGQVWAQPLTDTTSSGAG
jgi:hypothetical protein